MFSGPTFSFGAPASALAATNFSSTNDPSNGSEKRPRKGNRALRLPNGFPSAPALFPSAQNQLGTFGFNGPILLRADPKPEDPLNPTSVNRLRPTQERFVRGFDSPASDFRVLDLGVPGGTVLLPLNGGLGQLSMLPSGELLLADPASSRIYVMTAPHVWTIFLGSTVPSSTFVFGSAGPSPRTKYSTSSPMGICTTDDGWVYFTDAKSNSLKRISPYDGMVSDIGFSSSNGLFAGASGFSSPKGIHFTGQGHLLVAEQFSQLKLVKMPSENVSKPEFLDPRKPRPTQGPSSPHFGGLYSGQHYPIMAEVETLTSVSGVGPSATGKVVRFTPSGQMKLVTQTGIVLSTGSTGFLKFDDRLHQQLAHWSVIPAAAGFSFGATSPSVIIQDLAFTEEGDTIALLGSRNHLFLVRVSADKREDQQDSRRHWMVPISKTELFNSSGAFCTSSTTDAMEFNMLVTHSGQLVVCTSGGVSFITAGQKYTDFARMDKPLSFAYLRHTFDYFNPIILNMPKVGFRVPLHRAFLSTRCSKLLNESLLAKLADSSDFSRESLDYFFTYIYEDRLVDPVFSLGGPTPSPSPPPTAAQFAPYYQTLALTSIEVTVLAAIFDLSVFSKYMLFRTINIAQCQGSSGFTTLLERASALSSWELISPAVSALSLFDNLVLVLASRPKEFVAETSTALIESLQHSPDILKRIVPKLIMPNIEPPIPQYMNPFKHMQEAMGLLLGGAFFSKPDYHIAGAACHKSIVAARWPYFRIILDEHPEHWDPEFLTQRPGLASKLLAFIYNEKTSQFSTPAHCMELIDILEHISDCNIFEPLIEHCKRSSSLESKDPLTILTAFKERLGDALTDKELKQARSAVAENLISILHSEPELFDSVPPLEKYALLMRSFQARQASPSASSSSSCT